MSARLKLSHDEIKQLLALLHYKNIDNDIWKKRYNEHSCTIKVDFSSETILYPEPFELGDRTTSNFVNSENFVVLECVDRLLRKGYPPDCIVLEHKWALGRTNKGKLDILVKNKDSQPYLMIECKTHGEEYEKELAKMLKDGGQLFSYWQQDRNAEYLCLYTSKFNTNSIEFKSSIVKIENEFRSLGDVKEVHNRWNKQFLYSGIFEDDISAYGVQLNPLKRKDLKPLREEDGSRIYNQFLEILRHNVVSDKGNAFNKIFNLFLCKILDEDKQDDAILDFQWIEGQDNEEILLGRLNGLYKQGMADYLHKEITDYSVEDIDTNQIDSSVERIIKELRLYKNQEFAFVDVYNKESFLENAQIVIEVIKLLQGWQIRYAQKQQFLGEFFELLLNTGFKQESGQYFTPVPLVRFILGSLPITEIIQKKLNENERDFLPHVIDFACGSGHFLTEMMDVLQGEIENIDSSSMTPAQNARWKGYKADEFGWAKNFIYGIERDYRLAKTAKLACFLNGDGEAEIIHASGLEPFGNKAYIGILNSNSAKKDNNKFDILVANPPYAVSGFKSTVNEGKNLLTCTKK